MENGKEDCGWTIGRFVQIDKKVYIIHIFEKNEKSRKMLLTFGPVFAIIIHAP